MAYLLYGSQTSPFVRRLRMLMHGLTYEFHEMNVFETQDATLLNKINPLNQIPVLRHEEKTIWDSRQIFNYLNSIHEFEKLNWRDENLLTGIEGAMDSGIALLLMKRSGMDIEGNDMFIARQRDRIESVLDYLRDQKFSDWNFASMSLYAFLDWGQFRNIFSLEKRPELQNFLRTHAERPAVVSTQIPKAQ